MKWPQRSILFLCDLPELRQYFISHGHIFSTSKLRLGRNADLPNFQIALIAEDNGEFECRTFVKN